MSVEIILHNLFLKNFILFLNFTILYWFCQISKWICHRYTCAPHPEPSSLLPPHTLPLGRPSAPAPSIQYRASNLDWWLISYMILYVFQCHSPKFCTIFPISVLLLGRDTNYLFTPHNFSFVPNSLENRDSGSLHFSGTENTHSRKEGYSWNI